MHESENRLHGTGQLSFRLSHNYSFQKMAGAGNGSGNPYGGGVPRPTGAPAENY